MHVSNIFLESVTFASACNKVLRKRFLEPDTIGLIPTGGYTCNNTYTKKAMIWLLDMEQKDGVKLSTGAMAGSIKYPNYPNLVWTVTVQSPKRYISSTVVFMTGIRVSRSVTSPQRVAIR